MNAKVLKNLLLMLVIMMTSLSASADSGSSQDTSQNGNGTAVLDLIAHDPKTKRMPSRNRLEIVYADGSLTLFSNYYEGAFSLRFENYDTGESHEVSSILVGESIPVQLNYGEYEVKAISEEGIVLSGFMQVY